MKNRIRIDQSKPQQSNPSVPKRNPPHYDKKEEQPGGRNKKKEAEKKDPLNKRKSNGEKKSFKLNQINAHESRQYRKQELIQNNSNGEDIAAICLATKSKQSHG